MDQFQQEEGGSGEDMFKEDESSPAAQEGGERGVPASERPLIYPEVSTHSDKVIYKGVKCMQLFICFLYVYICY